MIQDRTAKKEIIGVYMIEGDMDGMVLASTRKPNIFRRFLLSLLGIKWVSKKNIAR